MWTEGEKERTRAVCGHGESEMKLSNLSTVVYGALSAALLAVLLLRPDIFNYWQRGVLFAAVAILALLAFRNVGR